MHKTKYELAREIVEEYHNAFLQGDTMLHIQEWIDEQIKIHKKNPAITVDEEGAGDADIEKGEKQQFVIVADRK